MKLSKKKKNSRPSGLRPYNAGFLSKIPEKYKILFFKWWCVAAVYYFIGIGMPDLMGSVYDVMFILGLVIGALYGTLIKFIIKDMRVEDVSKYAFITSDSPLRIVTNVFYAYLVLIFVVMSYESINRVINLMLSKTENIYLPAEPILFALLYVLFDIALISVKNRFKKKKSFV